MVYPYSSANRTVNQSYTKQDFSSAGKTINTRAINYAVVGKINPTQQSSSTVSHGNNVDLWKIDMGKEANFTVQISDISKPNMKHKVWGPFLPIKSISYEPVAIETQKFKAGIFVDLPIPVGRRIGKIELTVQDTEDHYYENQFYDWYTHTIPDSFGYIGYFEDMVKTFTYTEYNNIGKTVKTYYMEVLLDGGLQVSRSYESKDLKTFSVTLLVVGLISTSINESLIRKNPFEPPI